MMDLDTLRSGLRAAPGQPLGAVDIEHVMARGRRLRVRRRLLAGGGAAALAAAVLAASAGASWLAQPRPAVPGGTPVTAPPSSAAPSLAAPSLAAQGQDPVGAVVPTGMLDRLVHPSARTLREFRGLCTPSTTLMTVTNT